MRLKSFFDFGDYEGNLNTELKKELSFDLGGSFGGACAVRALSCLLLAALGFINADSVSIVSIGVIVAVV